MTYAKALAELYLALSALSMALTAITGIWGGAPPWLVALARWVGVFAVDVHKLTNGPSTVEASHAGLDEARKHADQP